jgi:hypothetical protein
MAMKANNPKMVEILVAKGAYYVFLDVYNNLIPKQNVDDQSKYLSLQMKEVPQAIVVEESIVRDCSIKETLKYARVKSIIAMKLYADKLLNVYPYEHKFHHLATILSKDEYTHLLLKMAINKGDSIAHKNGVSN